MNPHNYLDLADYRRTVAELYGRVRRAAGEAEDVWGQFCQERDKLFQSHPQSALSKEQTAAFKGLRYYPYNPGLVFVLPIDRNVEPQHVEMALEEDGLIRLLRFGKISFQVDGQPVSLDLFWITGYAGSIFLPFRDATNRAETYGGGRYLLDTIKGADLGRQGDRLVIDFNYAYNPSCAYNPRWSCPLAPVENWLPVPIRAGELRYNPD